MYDPVHGRGILALMTGTVKTKEAAKRRRIPAALKMLILPLTVRTRPKENGNRNMNNGTKV